jgi:hypothetical protein
MRSIVRRNPGEGPQLYRGTVTPHPDRIFRCDPTSPIEVGFIRLRLLVMPNSGKPELGRRGEPSGQPSLHQAADSRT